MRENRKKEQKKIIRNIAFSGIFCLGIIILLIVLVIFIKNIKSNDTIEGTELSKKTEITDETVESTTSEIGKSVNEVKKDEQDEKLKNNISSNTNANNTQKNTNATNKDVNTNKEASSTNKELSNITNNKNESSSINKENTQKETKNNESKNVSFVAPVKGEIIKEFASDSLVFSETLQEWITHNGIDIKADKTQVVAAAAEGTVESIKNDPRYGLTVIICHENGYKTIYSNLLTSEFVVEGEKVTQGQTIGTIGNSASFEGNDTYHLHFELLKDGRYEDPTIYINL